MSAIESGETKKASSLYAISCVYNVCSQKVRGESNA